MIDAEVAVVGAGVAGLAAARLLARHGRSCVLLEAGSFIGGRVRTLRKTGWEIPIELGAEFVHGRPAPTLALEGGAVGLVSVPEQRAMVKNGHAALMPNTWQRFAKAMAGACNADDSESVLRYLERAKLSPGARDLASQMVEGYEAAPLDDVSARSIAEDADASGGDFKQYRTSNGYDSVLALLARELMPPQVSLRLQNRVRRIGWSRGSVELQLEAGDEPMTLRAKACLLTVSVGVLQAAPSDGGIEITPRPKSFAALSGIHMGAALRVILRFEQAPWIADLDGRQMEFAHVPDAPFQTLWRERRAGQEQITAWAGGKRAWELSRLSTDAAVVAALRSLALGTGETESACRSRLIEAHSHDFNSDPLFRGAYSYVRPGGLDAAEHLREPCEDTLFFAGEALDLEFPSTVAGALGSGETAARRILTALSR